MKTFLEHVAEDIIRKYGTDLSHMAVVFPNKRAALFLNQHLARLVQKPVWSPAYVTISDLFRQHSTLNVASPIKLVCDIHKSFCRCTGSQESLDKFYGWGQLLISDFDDIDKNMADADKVFANLRDIHELDDMSFLSDGQRELLERFFHVVLDNRESELRQRFLRLWSHFGDIYHDFNDRLEAQNLTYEGALYRRVVEQGDINFKYDTYLFVGFNMLQRVEQRLFTMLKEQGRARFYWDFDRYFMPDRKTGAERSEAGRYISMYLDKFPNELDTTDDTVYDIMRHPKSITYMAAPTETIQARYVSEWLKGNDRTEAGNRTAIVMCDESLLKTVVHCLPEEVKEVNVTTGYPLSQTPVSALVRQVLMLYTQGLRKDTGRFRLHYVNFVLRHPYARYVSDKASDLLRSLNAAFKYYPTREELCLDDGLAVLFPDIDALCAAQSESLPHSAALILTLNRQLQNILTLVAHNAKDERDPLFQESVFRMYTLLNQLNELICNGDLDVDVATYTRLITQLVNSTSIPFHGEPAVGIQVMGLLETRNLDFDHLLLLSCNEGNMPKGVDDASFIPHAIRKAYGLTTIDNKVAIYSYYFHSLMQRATDITVAYNNSTNDGHTGEMSRFMIQMMVESGQSIGRKTLQSGQETTVRIPTAIVKDEHVQTKLKQLGTEKPLSPTAINTYLRCPVQFFYKYICGLREEDNVDVDEIDNRIFGNIFHSASEIFYRDKIGLNRMIHKSDLEEYTKHPELLLQIVDKAFEKDLFNPKGKGNYHPEYNGLQLLNREVILQYLVQLLRIDMRLTPFVIRGLEVSTSDKIRITTADGARDVLIGGKIDRLDEVETTSAEPRLRVVDYKTSRGGDKRPANMDEVFSSEHVTTKHSDYYLQTMFYSNIVRNDQKMNPGQYAVSPALLYIQHAGAAGYDSTLSFGKEKITDIAAFATPFGDGLRSLLEEIFNPGTPFTPTEDRKRCEYCPFVKLCGKA